MKYFFVALFALGLWACAGQQLPNMPKGSYAYGDVNYTQTAGASAEAGVHIPLGRGYAK